MKKIFLLFLFLQLCKPIVALAQLNASQIKKDGVTVIGNAQNKLAVDTVTTIPTKDWVLNNTSGGGGGTWGSITGTLSNQTDLQSALNAKLSLSDTASMLTRYLRSNSATLLYYPLSSNPSSYLVAADIAGKLNISDTATMLNRYLLTNTASGIYATISNLALKVAIADTSTMLINYLGKGLAASTYQPLITTGTTLQYFRGDLSLATFPTAVSSFSNDAGYATATSSTAFSNKTGNISQWTNDAGYITSSGVTPAALTKVDDTNVTLTLGGTPSTALLQAASITAGWTGTLADGRIASASTWNAKESALTFSTGLTRSTNTVTVNTSQNIATLSNLTSNGFVKTSGGTGTLSIDGNTYFNVSNNLSEGTAATMRTNIGLGSVENTAVSTWAGSGNITTVGTITSGAAMQEGAEASITNNSGAANDTQVPATTCRFYNYFTLPSTGKLYVITGIEWKNGTVVAGLVVCAIQQVDASPPTNAIVVLSALGQTVTATGTSSVQRVSVISTNVFRGGALLAVFIQGANATQRFMTATVGSSNIRKNVTSTAAVESADGSAWVAYTESAYCKIYYREYK